MLNPKDGNIINADSYDAKVNRNINVNGLNDINIVNEEVSRTVANVAEESIQ
ncbi:MAG: hypothetical protein MJ119_04015 [Lachnospiraceae bacterium]|nr:hypothetical protein [Lachnospiraceae bacterium]